MEKSLGKSPFEKPRRRYDNKKQKTGILTKIIIHKLKKIKNIPQQNKIQ
jgi:hypothetical protein